MRKCLSIFASVLACVVMLLTPAFAQTNTTAYAQPWFFAVNFGQWSLHSQQANVYTFSPGGLCSSSSATGLPFFDFATNAPVLITDPVSANSELVTPSAVVNNGSQCGITVSPTNQHYSFTLSSGTGGLQESLNALSVSSASTPALIILDRRWYAAVASLPSGTAASVIAAAKGNAGAILEDVTTSPATYYTWSGAAFVSVSGVTGGSIAPTSVAGAGAGTAPTISTVGNGTSGVVLLKTGTSTTTGTLFTSTFAATGVNYGACSLASVGGNAYNTFTIATTYSANHAVLTATVNTTAPTASTQYYFAYNCQ